MTRLTECASRLIQAVTYEMGINDGDILRRCSRREIVDARQMVIYALATQGFCPRRIASQMCVTPRYVHHIIANFGDRMRYDRLLRNSYERVMKQVGNDGERTASAL